MEAVDSIQESQQLRRLSVLLCKRESAAALKVSGQLLEIESTEALKVEGEWTTLQKRIDSGSKVVGSSTERLDRNRLYDRETC